MVKIPLVIGTTVPTQQLQSGDTLDAVAKLEVAKAGTLQGTRKKINFVEGANVTLTVADNSGSDQVDVTIAASGGGGGGGDFIPITGTATGDNVTGPIVFDGNDGSVYEKVFLQAEDGNANILKLYQTDENTTVFEVNSPLSETLSKWSVGGGLMGFSVLDTSSGGVISSSIQLSTTGSILDHVHFLSAHYFVITSTSNPQGLFAGDFLVNQGGTQSAFTFNLTASPKDGELISVSFNNAITSLTISGNGHSVLGAAVTTAAIGDHFEYKYYATASAWIRIK